MASYPYTTNQALPPAQDQTSAYQTYDFNQQQPQQWNQANVYGQAATGTYQTSDQQNAYASTNLQQPQYGSYGQQQSADNGYNFNYGGYQQSGAKKNDNYNRGGNSNFRNNQGNNKGNFNKGPRGNYGSSGSGMEEQQDTIFVSGIAEDTTEEQLIEHFGAIGIIKLDKKTRKPKIWVYKDKETGKPKGEVTITYDDPPTASSAIQWFNGKELNGATLKVELAQRKNNYLNNAGGGGGGNRNNFGGNRNRDYDKPQSNDRGNTNSREGDWTCPDESCKNNNFAWRNTCNRCKSEKPSGTGGGGNSSYGGSDRRNNNLPYERRGGQNNRDNRGGDRGSFGGQRNNGNRNGNQDRGSFNRNNNRSGGPMRGSNDNRRSGPY